VIAIVLGVESKTEECQKYGGTPIWIHNVGLVCFAKEAVMTVDGRK